MTANWPETKCTESSSTVPSSTVASGARRYPANGGDVYPQPRDEVEYLRTLLAAVLLAVGDRVLVPDETMLQAQGGCRVGIVRDARTAGSWVSVSRG